MSKLTIYFNSGNKVTINNVKNWEVKGHDGKTVGISITQKPSTTFSFTRKRLIVTSVNVDNIDCIVEH